MTTVGRNENDSVLSFVNKISASLDSLHVPREMATAFFAAFARFEYALKRCDYVCGDKARADANWDGFGKVLNETSAASYQEVLSCCPTLEKHPPQKQVYENKQLKWIDVERESDFTGLFLKVRTVRNNMFHGGKFPDGPVPDPARDENLVRECLTVLDRVLALPDLPVQLREFFWDFREGNVD